MKVAELTGAQLDYWVAMAGEEWKHFDVSDTMTLDPSLNGVRLVTYSDGQQAAMLQPSNPFRQDPRKFCPSSDWAHGGPIIERAHMYIEYDADGYWCAHTPVSVTYLDPAPLVAAMRAYVSSKFGSTVLESEAA